MPSEQETATHPKTTLKWAKSIADALLSILVLAPLVIGYWRGTWYLIEIHLFPAEIPTYDLPRVNGLIISLVVGISGGIFFNYTQIWFMKKICGMKSAISELFCKRAYCYIFGIVLINHWRGVWGFWDVYTGRDLKSGLICFVIGSVSLLILRCFRNCIFPPLATTSDLCDEFFIIDSRFRIPRSRPILFFLDNLFSVGVVGSLIVFVVRGGFAILDNIYPLEILTYPLYLTTFGIGMILVLLCLLLQKPTSLVSIRLEKGGHWFLKLIFEDLYIFVCFAASIHIWHSVWGLSDVFVYSHNMELSSWICHVIGIGGLMLLFHGNSVLVKGCHIDGELSNGQGCWLHAQSLTIFEADPADRKARNERMKERVTGIKRNEKEKPAVSSADQESVEQTLLTRLDGGRVGTSNAQPENFDI